MFCSQSGQLKAPSVLFVDRCSACQFRSSMQDTIPIDRRPKGFGRNMFPACQPRTPDSGFAREPQQRRCVSVQMASASPTAFALSARARRFAREVFYLDFAQLDMSGLHLWMLQEVSGPECN